MNRLYYGDCFTIMAEWPSACVDLIYLDPPFNSNRNYNAIYKDETGRSLPDQIEAFCDMWELDAERERAIRTMPVLMRESGIDDATAELWRLWMRALRDTQPRLLAYLSYMAERLLIMSRLLKPKGSLYFHCDPTVSHYVKPLLDAVFGHDNFRNEIIWRRYGAHNDVGQGSKRFGRVHDVLLMYGKTDSVTWNQGFTPLNENYVKGTYRYTDEAGRRFRTTPLTAPGGAEKGNPIYEWNGHIRAWRYSKKTMHGLHDEGQLYYSKTGYPSKKTYLDQSKGVPIQDIWADITSLSGTHKERMGYVTQKPLALLERIILASSNPGDVVLDPFCGCATTLEAAHKLGRQWIGIDIAIHAVKRVARVRLEERLGLIEGQDFTVEGVPRTVEGAQDLWQRDKYHFQKWAVEQVDGFVTTKRSADGGVDGRVYFAVPHAPDLQSMVIEVKGGANVPVTALRALKGVLDYDTALIAGLITMNPIKETQARNFNRFMAEAGSLEILGIEYPRMQILSVGEILEGKRFETPTVAGRHEPQPRMPGLPV